MAQIWDQGHSSPLTRDSDARAAYEQSVSIASSNDCNVYRHARNRAGCAITSGVASKAALRRGRLTSSPTNKVRLQRYPSPLTPLGGTEAPPKNVRGEASCAWVQRGLNSALSTGRFVHSRSFTRACTGNRHRTSPSPRFRTSRGCW